MQYIEIQRQVAQNIGTLSSDSTTIVGGRVSQTDIQNYINIVMRETVFGLLSDKYPDDFARRTAPFDTYTVTGTADSASTGSNLTTATDVFTNDMYDIYVQNTTDSEKLLISAFVDEQNVTLESAIDDTWDGDTFYVLGNRFTLEANTTDLKEILKVEIKYASTDNDWTVMERRDRNDIHRTGNEEYSKSAPVWSYTSTAATDGNGNDTRIPTIEIFPIPDDYQGQIRVTYVERPRTMSEDTDEPFLNVQGLSQVLINGATAWALRTEGRHDEVGHWEERDPRTGALYPKGLLAMIRYYKPKQRSGPSKITLDPYYQSMNRINI